MAMTAARSIVEQDGLHGLTARGVAGAIGYSPGTLYNLFDGLDELVLHVNAATLDALHAAVSEGGLSGNPEADLNRVLRRYVAFLEANPTSWSAIFDHRLAPGTELPEWYLGKVQRLMRLVEDALAPLFAPGEERERSEAAATLWSGLHGICTLAQDGRLSLVSAQSVPQMARSLIASYLAGLRSRAAMRAEHA